MHYINLNVVENGNYQGNLDACITIVEAYLNKIRENNVYDNSAIVIMSDHGWSPIYEDRSNPILYIKGFNEKHEYLVSDKKISYQDLAIEFTKLIDGYTTDKLFVDLDNSERRYLFYEFRDEDNLIEYSQTGYAWETSKLIPTGKKYVRE